MKPSLAFIHEALDLRREHQRFRHVVSVDASTVNFCSNDYLGLSTHPALIQASLRAVTEAGTGSGASRLVSGTSQSHLTLERELAEFTGREAALLFNSGYQLNTSVLPAIADRSAILYLDKLNHNSLYQGALLSKAKIRRYRHCDIGHLDQLLAEDAHLDTLKLIVTESVFSMDGDVAPIDALVALADRHHAVLMVDEAHSIGLFGDQGRGLCHGNSGVDIVIGTFGKAFGSFGAFVACEGEMRDYLVNFCGGFIYTTALPPAVVAATLAATRLMPSLDVARRTVLDHASKLRSGLVSLGFDTRGSSSAIIPAIIGDDGDALAASEALARAGFLVQAIRPPTVEEGTARLRFTVNAAHTSAHIEALLLALASR